MILYSYFRSSCSYRVRIALNLKDLDYRYEPVHLLRDGGEQKQAAYQALNPQQLVPTLITEDNIKLTQSVAIIEYLEETYPTPALLPTDRILRAQVRACSMLLACEAQPLNNLQVLNYLSHDLSIDDNQRKAWYKHWLTQALTAFERMIESSAHAYCFGDAVTLADICLIPQLYNAKRFNISLDDFPKIRAVDEHCLSLSAFQKAHPDNQIDAV